MNATFDGSSLPKDVWAEIFQAMEDNGDFQGIKQCSRLNRAFRASLAPRILDRIWFPSPISSDDILLWFGHICHFVKHLTIRHAEPWYRSASTPQPYVWEDSAMVNLLKNHFCRIQSLTLLNLKFENLGEDLMRFLDSFPSLQKLCIPWQLIPPRHELDHARFESEHNTSAPQMMDTISGLRLKEIEAAFFRKNVVLPFLNIILRPAGHHLRHLNIAIGVSSDELAWEDLVAWICDTQVVTLRLRFGFGSAYDQLGNEDLLLFVSGSH
jgi:hypothetical protein